MLVEALRFLTVPVSVTIVGDGSQKDVVMERALALPNRVNVSFVGAISHDEVLRLMIEHDMLVFPSLVVENCPGVLLEALSVGLPVIASDVGGVRELVDADALVPPGNHAHWLKLFGNSRNTMCVCRRAKYSTRMRTSRVLWR